MDLFSFSRMAAIFEKYSGHFLKGAEMALRLYRSWVEKKE